MLYLLLITVVVGCSNGAVCLNGATCYDFGELQHPTGHVLGFKCKCTEGFEGRFCEKGKPTSVFVNWLVSSSDDIAYKCMVLERIPCCLLHLPIV